MKRTIFFAILAILCASPLLAQEPVPDSLDLVREVEAQNLRLLSERAARPVVVAQKRVARERFYLWYGHLTDGSWGPDANWYPDETDRLYLSVQGASGDRDIVWSEFCDDTLWSRPRPVSREAVSPGDELFPMRSPDGKRLYFSSNGLFGMGGYDIYEASLLPDGSWGRVRNLGLPFNSPGDDLLFCDTPDGRYSIFASNRACGPDEVVIYVLRQESPVYGPVTPEEAARLSKLDVTAPDGGYPFVRQSEGSLPKLAFEKPEEQYEMGLQLLGKEGALAKSNRLPDGLVYQVQLFVSGYTPTPKQLKGLSPVYSHQQKSGKKMYAAGAWRTFAEAEQGLRTVRRAGFSSAFVVAFNDGKPISLANARKKESEVKVITEEIRIVK